MNKTIIININSIVFHIEEDAYDMLRTYMIDIKKHFGHSVDSKEILLDIENRIAEMFTDKIQSGKKEVINSQDVEEVITQMGRVSDFEMDEDTAGAQAEQAAAADTTFQVGKKLMRDSDDKVLGGVCAGLGHYFGIESRWVRLLFALLFLFAGTGILFYVILWIIMPLAVTRVDKMEMRGEAPNIQNFKKNFEEEMGSIRENFSGAGANVNRGVRSAGNVIGNILIVFVKIIGLLFAFSIGLTLLGLLIAVIVMALGVSSINNDGIIEGFNFISQKDTPWAFIAAGLSTAIPLIGIFYLIIRILFNRRPMNNYLAVGLLVIFLVSAGASTYYTAEVARDFKERSIITQEQAIGEFDTYYLRLNNSREIKVSDNVDKKNTIRLNFKNNDLMKVRMDDISINFEQIDSLAKPYIKYEYAAKGKNYKVATLRASNIDYKTAIDSNQIAFDSHFDLLNEELYRDQEVTITLFIPVGKKIVLDNSIRWKVRNVPFDTCYPEDSYDIKQTVWKMTERGINCAIMPVILDEEIEETETGDVIISEHNDTRIKIDSSGISIQTNKNK